MGGFILVRSMTARMRRTGSRPALAPREAYQRAFHIVKQGWPGSAYGLRARDEHIVASGPSVEGQKHTGRFAQTALGPIANDGVPDLLGGCKARPDWSVRGFGALALLNHDAGSRLAGAITRTQKIAPQRNPRGAIWILQVYASVRAQADSRLRPFARRRAMT
jgi:hypothetical protein